MHFKYIIGIGMALALLVFLFLQNDPPTSTEQVQSKNNSNTLHILYYDNIEYEEDPYQFLNGLAFNDFKNHLTFFQDEAYEVIALDQIDTILTRASAISKKYVAIVLNTQDEEALAHAYPLAKRYGFPVNFSVNSLELNNKNVDNDLIKLPLLNINTNAETTDLIAKLLNDETSRFRDIFSKTPRSIMISNTFFFQKNKAIIERYDFEKIYLPTNQANNINALNDIISYINVTPSFSHLDVLETYMNRQPFEYSNLIFIQNDNNDGKTTNISWGLTLPQAITPNDSPIQCMASNGTKAVIYIIENRIEIRLSRDISQDALKVHCTKAILDKNLNKTNNYQYMVLHEPS